MTVSPTAGHPADPAMLVNVPALVTAYYAEAPDPSVPAQRVAFGTSGHRGSALDKAFNEAHVLAIAEAICLYRALQRIDGPLFLGMDTHALSVPARASAIEVMAARGVALMIADRDQYTPTPAVSHAILTYNRGRTTGLADGVVITPSLNPPHDGGFKYNPPHRGTGRTRGHPVDRGQSERAARRRPSRGEADPVREGSACLHDTSARLRHGLHERSRQRDRHGRHPWRRDHPGCGSTRGRGRPLLGSDRRALRPESHRRQRGRRSDFPVHDGRLGRPDSHGPLLALCDAAADRSERSVRDRLCLRPRPRPAWHRHAQRGVAPAESLSVGGHPLSVPASPGVARGRGGGQDRGEQPDDRPRHRCSTTRSAACSAGSHASAGSCGPATTCTSSTRTTGGTIGWAGGGHSIGARPRR